MRRRLPMLALLLLLAACGGKSGPPALTGGGNPPPTPAQWQRIDEEVCNAFNPPPAEIQRCLEQFRAMSGSGGAVAGSSRP